MRKDRDPPKVTRIEPCSVCVRTDRCIACRSSQLSQPGMAEIMLSPAVFSCVATAGHLWSFKTDNNKRVSGFPDHSQTCYVAENDLELLMRAPPLHLPMVRSIGTMQYHTWLSTPGLMPTTQALCPPPTETFLTETSPLNKREGRCFPTGSGGKTELSYSSKSVKMEALESGLMIINVSISPHTPPPTFFFFFTELPRGWQGPSRDNFAD